jgi:hypothetical protein
MGRTPVSRSGRAWEYAVVHREAYALGTQTWVTHDPERGLGVQCEGLADTDLALTRTQVLSATTKASHPREKVTSDPRVRSQGTESSRSNSSAVQEPTRKIKIKGSARMLK